MRRMLGILWMKWSVRMLALALIMYVLGFLWLWTSFVYYVDCSSLFLFFCYKLEWNLLGSMELETMELVRYKYSSHVCSAMRPFFFELALVCFPFYCFLVCTSLLWTVYCLCIVEVFSFLVGTILFLIFGLFYVRRLVLLLVMCTKRPTMALGRMRSWLMHRPLWML